MQESEVSIAPLTVPAQIATEQDQHYLALSCMLMYLCFYSGEKFSLFLSKIISTVHAETLFLVSPTLDHIVKNM